MAGNPDVLALLEEMLDSGRTAEDVCRDCPELLPEVRKRWQAFRLVDGSLAALFPDPGTTTSTDVTAAGSPAGLPQVPGYRVEAVLGSGGMGVVYRAWHLRLNRAVVVSMVDGPAAALDAVAELEPELTGFRPLFAVRAELLERLGEVDAAAAEFLTAAELPGNAAEAEVLRRRAAALVPPGSLTDPAR